MKIPAFRSLAPDSGVSVGRVETAKVEKLQNTAARWSRRRWRDTSSAGDMLDELEWPSLKSCRERSSLTFFYKIHSGTGKDLYLKPSPNVRRTRASLEIQFTRQFAHIYAMKNSNFKDLLL